MGPDDVEPSGLECLAGLNFCSSFTHGAFACSDSILGNRFAGPFWVARFADGPMVISSDYSGVRAGGTLDCGDGISDIPHGSRAFSKCDALPKRGLPVDSASDVFGGLDRCYLLNVCQFSSLNLWRGLLHPSRGSLGEDEDGRGVLETA